MIFNNTNNTAANEKAICTGTIPIVVAIIDIVNITNGRYCFFLTITYIHPDSPPFSKR